MGLFETIGTNVGAIFGARKNKQEARENRRRNMDYVSNIDWTPKYANDMMANGGAYQKTESPLADSYLNSILTGTNPDMVFSGSPNADRVKEEKTIRRSQLHGTPEQNMARQREIDTGNPYETWTPDDPRHAAAVAARNPGPQGGPALPGMNDLPAANRGPGEIGYDQEYSALAKQGFNEQQARRLMELGQGSKYKSITDRSWRNSPGIKWNEGVGEPDKQKMEAELWDGYRKALEADAAGDTKMAKKWLERAHKNEGFGWSSEGY